ncbi:uncharacterized protein MELLADRAFT_87440 [Melampsora larici-populina 98AG31]|uniref:Uncharacterized protein n=1 Tax=Melampsora larici-populina (strain 98AG31 / pathotype 3-4-7) TaxID=747676 RepID=F4RNA5_MELLP|nr:uncharacterized protein MELLADRAFT_87440 [Melampsora larici-populina 98AG31]EGG05955.1 hypothetical protein MELLADRAFT_87440 [Melampsora larici-populina 98AG31]
MTERKAFPRLTPTILAPPQIPTAGNILVGFFVLDPIYIYKTKMLPPSSSLVPSSNGPTLRPRTPTQPRPDFIIQSPDLCVASICPSPIRETVDSDNEASVWEVTSGESNTTDGIGGDKVEVVEESDNNNLTVPTTNKKKGRKCKGKAPVAKTQGRPRGSGASGGLTRRPPKKSRKGRVEVSSIVLCSYFKNSH